MDSKYKSDMTLRESEEITNQQNVKNESNDGAVDSLSVKDNLLDEYTVTRQGKVAGKSISSEDSFWCSSRFALIIIGFFGFLNLYALRVDMSVAIVCMTRPEGKTSLISNASKGCSFAEGNVSQSNFTVGCDMPERSKLDDTFDWDKETQGFILGSFFLGYVITQLPGAWLAGKYGGKRLYGGSMFVCAVATLLTPLAARTNVVLLIVMRAVAGICQGAAIPCTQTLLSYWIPPLQRSTSVGFVYAGTIFMRLAVQIPTFGFCAQYGSISACTSVESDQDPYCSLTASNASVVSKYECHSVLCVDGFDGGWPSIFYVLGCLGVVWCLVWMYVVSDSPVSHPRISKKEREYIVHTLKSELDISKKSTRTPWSKLFTSLPVWAIIVTHTCAEWGAYTFLTNIPSYMEDVLKFDIKKAGFLASLPYLGFWVVTNISAYLADFLRKRGYISTTTARKVFNSIGNIIPAIFIVIMGNVADDPGTAVAMLTLGVAMSGCQYGSGFIVNPVDIAPRYAGIILAISNTTGSLGGFFAPVAIGIITVDKTREQWKTVFYIAAGVYAFGAIFYAIFASGELQPWARDEDGDHKIDIMEENKELQVNDVENTTDL